MNKKFKKAKMANLPCSIKGKKPIMAILPFLEQAKSERLSIFYF